MESLDIGSVLGLVISIFYDDKKKMILLRFNGDNCICIKFSDKEKYELLKKQCYVLGDVEK